MKRLLAGLLTMAMTLSMTTATAFADETDGDDSNENVVVVEYSTSTSTENNTIGSLTIQPDKKGSITIHKYVKDDMVEGWPNVATGEELKVPTGATPLNGVEFTIYKLADKATLLDYYSGNGDSTLEFPTRLQLIGQDPNGSDVCRWDTTPAQGANNEDDDDNYRYDKVAGFGKWVFTGDYAPGRPKHPTEIAHLTTGGENQKKGEVKFTDLEVGLYLVMETKSPDVVYRPAEPFLVSIPMTVSNSWVYDVHAYPKNVTTTSGEVKMVKVGRVDMYDEPDDQEYLKGVKFQLQRLRAEVIDYGYYQQTEYYWEPVTETVDKYGNTTSWGEELTLDGTTYKGVITSGTDGTISVSNLPPGDYCFKELSTVDGYILPTLGAWHFRIRVNGELSWGGTESVDGREYIQSWDPRSEEEKNAEIKRKFYKEAGEVEMIGSTPYPVIGGIPYAVNERPDIEKGVVPKGMPKYDEDAPEDGIFGGYKDTDYVKQADYSVGDEIPYKLTIRKPGVNSEYFPAVFKVYDTPTNMKDNIESIKIWVLGEDGTYEEFPYAWPTELEGGGFEIDLSGAYQSEIVITYTATLTGDDDSVTAIGGNPNIATLEYTNAKGWGILGTNKISDSTVVYSGEIKVNKTDGTKTKKLEGVKFELYEPQAAGIKPGDKVGKRQTLTSAEAAEKGLENTLTTAYIKIGDTYETNSDGNFSIKGLSNGTYWLVETETLEGYNRLQKPLDVTLDFKYDTKWVSESTQEEKEIQTNDYRYNPDTGQWEYAIKTVTEFNIIKNKIDPINSIYSQTTNDGANLGKLIDVINRKGFNLPTTGGMGTFIFTFVGVAMMAAAVILFITSKKKEKGI